MAQFSFKLPDVGEGTAEAEIAEWRVNVGDRVEEDQPLVDMTTDKATVELTSPVRGIVLSIAGKAGEKAAVGSVLVTFDTAEDGSAQAAQTPSTEAAAPVSTAIAEQLEQSPEPARVASIADAPGAQAAARGRASAAPAVRRRAASLDIALPSVSGSGPEGRVTHADLDAYLVANSSGASVGVAAAPVDTVQQADFTEIAVTGLRRQIAERMQMAKRQIPHFSYVEEVDVTELEELRASLNSAVATGRPKLTLLPFLMRALVQARGDYPQINATYDDEKGVVRQYPAMHIGIATQTPRGLMVTVVRDAQARDVWSSATEVARLAVKARDGKATREELTGSTITITSLGTLGGVTTTPIINRPEVAIVGPNRIVERPVVRDGQVVARKMMNLSSSFDHRIIDGVYAAEFIQRVRSLLEYPATLFIR